MLKYKGKEYKIKSRGVKWNDKNDVKLRALRAVDMPVPDIARRFGCSESVINRRLRVLNLTENKWTSTQDRVLITYHQTKTVQELAQMLKINQQYIKDRLFYLNLSIKKT